MVLAVEAAANATGAIDTVATVGICDVFPGAINSIPSRVRLELDVRDIDVARRDGVLAAHRAGMREAIAARARRDRADGNHQRGSRPRNAIRWWWRRSCAGRGRARPGYQTMVSRAYHDSLFMSRIAPTAMLFIPCRGGVSHRPDEYAAPEDIASGALVLADAIALLADLHDRERIRQHGPRPPRPPFLAGSAGAGAGPYSAAISRMWPVFESSVSVFARSWSSGSAPPRSWWGCFP